MSSDQYGCVPLGAPSPSACNETRGEFGQAAGVAPFVVIPGQHLGHGAVEHLRRESIDNGRMRIANERNRFELSYATRLNRPVGLYFGLRA